MTIAEMAQHLLRMHGEEIEVREAGQKEYAHDEENAFRNFESLAQELGISREKILWVFLRKHLDGVVAHLNGHKSQRESVHGRIKDARMYLALLDGMIFEEESTADVMPAEYGEWACLPCSEKAAADAGDPENTRKYTVTHQMGRPCPKQAMTDLAGQKAPR